MKRIGIATIVFCLLAGLQAMAQATSTTTSSAAAKPAANSAAKPTANSAPKHVIYLEGAGTVQRTGGEASTPSGAGSKWPSPTYGTSASAEERAQSESGSASSGSQGGLRCLGPERRPCEEWNVRELSRRLEEKGAEHPALADIRALRLESSDGSVLCEQTSGAHCTSEQVRSLNEHVAQPLRCEIYFHQASAGQNPTTTAQTSTGTKSSAVSAGMASATVSTGTTQGTDSTVAGTGLQLPGNSSTTGNASSKTSTAASSTTNSTTSTPSKTQNNSKTQNTNSTAQNHAAATQHHPAPPHRSQPEH